MPNDYCLRVSAPKENPLRRLGQWKSGTHFWYLAGPTGRGKCLIHEYLFRELNIMGKLTKDLVVTQNDYKMKIYNGNAWYMFGS